jgi:hypothetical protein
MKSIFAMLIACTLTTAALAQSDPGAHASGHGHDASEANTVIANFNALPTSA